MVPRYLSAQLLLPAPWCCDQMARVPDHMAAGAGRHSRRDEGGGEVTIFGRFIFGSLAVFFAGLHYQLEIKPYARKRGLSTDDVVRAGCLATDRCIRKAFADYHQEADP